MTTELVESYVKAYNQALENVQLLKEELYSFFNPILKPVNIETEHLALNLCENSQNKCLYFCFDVSSLQFKSKVTKIQAWIEQQIAKKL